MARNLRRTILVSTLLISNCSGGFRPCEGPPSPLLGELRSHSSVAAVQAKAGASWRVVHQDPAQPQTSRRPPFVQLEAAISDFQVFGSRGPLELEFINDRLARVIFSPADPEHVFEALASQPGATRLHQSTLHLAPATEIDLLTMQDRTVLLVKDECLSRESEDWVRRYATLPRATECVG
jgi:hypothetical protein